MGMSIGCLASMRFSLLELIPERDKRVSLEWSCIALSPCVMLEFFSPHVACFT